MKTAVSIPDELSSGPGFRRPRGRSAAALEAIAAAVELGVGEDRLDHAFAVGADPPPPRSVAGPMLAQPAWRCSQHDILGSGASRSTPQIWHRSGFPHS
jgi:hypothetical protein